MFRKTKVQEGVTLYTRKSDQFKTVNFSIKWKGNLDEKSASARSVLANVLQDSNSLYRTQSELGNALDELYGTVLYTDVGKRGNTHIMSLSVECVNDEYLQSDGVLEDVISLIQTVIFEPNMVDGNFDSTIVNREKRSVVERIRSQYDDKARYAQKRMLEILRPNSSTSASSYGTEEDVNKLTLEGILSAYHQMLNEDEIDIYVVGDIDEENIIAKLQSVLRFEGRPVRQQNVTVEQSVSESTEIQHVREQQDMKQGKLHMGFSTPVTFHHPDYPKMQVTNGIFGGFAHSKLFMNVREKESMAYYSSSSYSSHYGLVYVMAGIDAELEDKAVKLITEQLTALQNGEITDLELEQTTALLKNGIKSTFDSAKGQIEVFDQFKELDENFTADQLISTWESVTKEDVQKMASEIDLEIVYLLSGKEAADVEEN
ncbi:EF-P 5-aminopentanol modification-associated protein YfmF [Sporosarcina sp. G11-34]|uniref:EF-P 5-aminopentanol modification-associated protein YfmF n=1 Tax=Sporosarcina sp. G11-34 TaxID=2849605 RepID=UPI0022A9A37B|nr:pitrilysin family protein [Sporosarcina sp. G11-34]MCZ2258762.1 insulinase family protein [Sporosarcina sp. G11-34]